MRILITNDDGINAPGLETLAEIAGEVAGPEGEVWTVAPAFEQSGVGHCISYTHPTMLSKFGERRYAAEGSPADCVLAGIHEVLKDTKPDLILSGVNRGNNAAENVLYSGTIGGAMEGALQGIPSIALSQFYGPGNASLENPFESAAEHGVRTVRAILDQGIWETRGYQVFYNVNFPPCPAAETKGIRVTTQGWRDQTTMGVEPHLSPSGRMFLWVRGGPQHHPTGEGTDVTANIDGHVSVTPLRADLTAYDLIADLRGRLDG